MRGAKRGVAGGRRAHLGGRCVLLLRAQQGARPARPSDDHDHDEEHGAALHIIGVSSGSTSFTLQLMHDGHADYTSTNNVPVTVN